MKRYGKLDLRNCDCMDLLRETEDNAYNLAIVDPPYGLKPLSVNRNRSEGYRHRRSMSKMLESAKGWNAAKPTKKYFDELFRVSVNQIVWGANNFTMP